MKKAVLIILSVSLFLMLAGFAFVAASGFALMPGVHVMTNYKYKELGKPQNAEKTADAAFCTSVSISAANSDIEVVPYDGNTIKLDYESLYQNEWAYSFDGSAMKLTNRKYTNAINGFGSFYSFLQALKNGDFDFENEHDPALRSVKLYIPSGAAPKLSITNVNGSVSLGGANFGSSVFNLVNSGLKVSGTAFSGEIRVNDVNGDLTMENVTGPTLTLQSVVNGQCTIDAPKFQKIDAKSFVNCSLSITGVDDPEKYSVSYKLVNGSVKIGGNTFSGSGNYAGTGDTECSVSFKGVNGNLSIIS